MMSFTQNDGQRIYVVAVKSYTGQGVPKAGVGQQGESVRERPSQGLPFAPLNPLTWTSVTHTGRATDNTSCQRVTVGLDFYPDG